MVLHAPLAGGGLVPESLCRRLGGAERIAELIEEAIDRHAVNPVLAGRLRGKDLPSLKTMAVQLAFAEANMVRAVVEVSEAELAAAMGDIAAALEAMGAGPREIEETVAVLRRVVRTRALPCDTLL